MTDAALDASVVLKWFRTDGERHVAEARAVRERFEAGDLRVLAPPLLWLEVLNVAGRRWRWDAPRLEQLTATLPALGFELVEPELSLVARWTGRGLTASDAAYVAAAEQVGVPLVTDDDEIVRHAPGVAVALGGSA